MLLSGSGKRRKSDYIKISSFTANQNVDDFEAECSEDERHGKDIMAANQELQEIKKSIDTVRDKLNKLAGQGERLQLTDEIIEISCQLDVLIRDYQRKSIEIQKMAKIESYT